MAFVVGRRHIWSSLPRCTGILVGVLWKILDFSLCLDDKLILVVLAVDFDFYFYLYIVFSEIRSS